MRSVLVAFISAGLIARGKHRYAAFLIAATGGMGIINTWIKRMVRRQRPRGIPGRRQASGYSFPSGHSSGSLVFFGSLGYLIWKLTRHRLLALLCLAAGATATWLIGDSRVGLRAHYRSDVLAGYAVGIVWLALVLRLYSHLGLDENV